MPTLPWCVGPMGVGVSVGTLLSSQIPQAPSDANPNEINIQDSSALSSGSLLCRLIADSFASVCEAGGACDPLIEKVLGVFSATSGEEVSRAVIASINSRVPTPSWRAGKTSLVRESFSEVRIFNSLFKYISKSFQLCICFQGACL